jgi:isopentenyl diphosphate isomerase/L-lactate dehydrogenase-like FMN-dependent dehydrogenase
MGQAGVARALEIMRTELAVTLALTGTTDVAAASRQMLVNPP